MLWVQLGAPGQPHGAPPALPAALARMIASLCSDQLHVFAWDNAHALDPQSAELIETAVAAASAIARGVLFAGRDGTPLPRSNGTPPTASFAFGELDDAEVRRARRRPRRPRGPRLPSS